ncbi:hypothetical protein GCM10025861_18100 [Methanobacterium petrolearium]|nr:hypothetical protein GCM10025861_18100 [Methanobacterium petrolearium]
MVIKKNFVYLTPLFVEDTHRGFHPAWKFEEVNELIFHDGKLTEKKDVSDKLAEVRKVFAK